MIGALTLTLASTQLLGFLRIPPDWQVAANGAILDHRARGARADQPEGQEPVSALAASLRRRPWALSYVGALLVWLGAIAYTGGEGAGGMLTTALSLAVFTVIVGVGQMFVITLGPGNIDLSLPANIGLASAVAMKTMDGADGAVALGLAAALGCGLAVGVANYLLIWALRIPPIIATLSSSFIIHSVDIAYGRGLQIKPPPGFADFTNIEFYGVPLLAILVVAVRARRRRGAEPHGLWPLRARHRAERARGAARRREGRAGRASSPMRCAARSAASTARCSPAISAAPMSTSATNISCCRSPSSSSAAPLLRAARPTRRASGARALFLVLLQTMLNTYGVSAGVRLLLTGLIIVAVIAAAGGEKPVR